MAEIFIGTARRHDVIVGITSNIVTSSVITIAATTAEEISGVQIAIEHVGVTAVARVRSTSLMATGWSSSIVMMMIATVVGRLGEVGGCIHGYQSFSVLCVMRCSWFMVKKMRCCRR